MHRPAAGAHAQLPDAGLRRGPLARRDRAAHRQSAGQREELDPSRSHQPQVLPVGRDADRVKSGNRELVERLAAEYVLGTLRGRARGRFERWLVSPQGGDIVKAWEARLAGLDPRLEPVTPPAAVWRGIENRLELRRKPVTRWLALAASLLLFAVIGFYAVRQPPAPPALAATQQALIQENAQTIYWRVELLGDNRELALQVQAAHALEAGKALELWVLPAPGVNHGQPVSL